MHAVDITVCLRKSEFPTINTLPNQRAETNFRFMSPDRAHKAGQKGAQLLNMDTLGARAGTTLTKAWHNIVLERWPSD